jgi:uncharacterized protein DUF1016
MACRAYSAERARDHTLSSRISAETLQQPSPRTDVEPSGYGDFLAAVVSRIEKAQRDAAIAVNTATILLYYDVGNDLLQRQTQRGWGAGVIRRLSQDLGNQFPASRGYSEPNLHYMRAFAAAWPDRRVVETVLSRVTWWHT